MRRRFFLGSYHWNKLVNKCCLLCREVGRAFASFLNQAKFMAKTSPPLAALSSMAGGYASRHGAGALWSLEVIGDGWIPQLLVFSLKKELWLHRGGLSPGNHTGSTSASK